MSRNFSFRDLQLIPELKGLSEIDMLDTKHDRVINAALAVLGFNLQAPVLYVPSKHRDLQGKVAVGFRATGDIDAHNRAYLTSPLSETIERLIAASKSDMSLTRELAKLMGSSVEWNDDYATDEAPDFEEELMEPDYQEVVDQLLILETIRDQVRGSPYNEAGGLKLPFQY